jgi:hypothetical protein
VAPEATAYAHRSTQYIVNAHGRWLSAADDARGISWARDLYREVAPFATGGVYVNFLSGDDADRTGAAYGANFDRLAAAKRLYDPENLFSVNQNIRPGG